LNRRSILWPGLNDKRERERVTQILFFVSQNSAFSADFALSYKCTLNLYNMGKNVLGGCYFTSKVTSRSASSRTVWVRQ
jgi:hypothetical protein